MTGNACRVSSSIEIDGVAKSRWDVKMIARAKGGPRVHHDHDQKNEGKKKGKREKEQGSAKAQNCLIVDRPRRVIPEGRLNCPKRGIDSSLARSNEGDAIGSERPGDFSLRVIIHATDIPQVKMNSMCEDMRL